MKCRRLVETLAPLVAVVFFGCSNNDTSFADGTPAKDAATSSDAAGSAHDASTGGNPGHTGDDAGTGNPGTGGGGVDAAPPCHPPQLYPPTSGVGVYCPYSGTDGGKDISCKQATEQCCETPADDAGASSCVTAGSTCPAAGSTIWQCDDPSECPSGQVCCAAMTLEQDSVCGYYRAGPGFNGTHCAAACAAGELTICEMQGECKTGTCTPFRALGNTAGACK